MIGDALDGVSRGDDRGTASTRVRCRCCRGQDVTDLDNRVLVLDADDSRRRTDRTGYDRGGLGVRRV